MEHYPFATGDLLCRPHARLAQSEPKVKGKMNGKPPLTFSSAGAILQIWQQRNAPLPSSHILFCFTSCFGVYTKLGTHPKVPFASIKLSLKNLSKKREKPRIHRGFTACIFFFMLSCFPRFFSHLTPLFFTINATFSYCCIYFENLRFLLPLYHKYPIESDCYYT